MQEVVVNKAISLLDNAIDGVEGAVISIVNARSVRDMFSDAKRASGQDHRRKKRHDTTTTSSAAPRALLPAQNPWRRGKLRRRKRRISLGWNMIIYIFVWLIKLGWLVGEDN